MKKIIRNIKNVIEVYQGDIILIYQMGKVGSSSIEKSLKLIKKDARHIHSFGNTDNYNLENRSQIGNLKIKVLRKLYKLAFKYRKKNLKIITLMRDPISRNISTLFQELSTMIYIHEKENNRLEQNIYNMLDEFLENYVDTNVPLKWFEKEFKYFVGIDIYKYPFNKQEGHLYIKKENIEVLLLTAEKLNNNENVIRKFINDRNFSLFNTNVSSKKWYSDIYKNYKTNHKLSENDLNKFYDSEVITYFYSDDDISKFKEKWTKNN
ncbi:putative capsular polysaccharide synthesis family protein [Aquibacillus rhizosphaerae]|uniref:Capsular polysaccharide synthesis family protein n=1 Tax=Aquibacillus rhizosphaerae TaxID=3051431 RepID=A0ABT7KZJ3_9BACI|nr:putative capsular polysaccharide synthesis family protein [Aquibacillus sp. LR5S19]MDL4838959.1 putative capsular polysaccharide synthesis family protein [Aquibacillus sp. LR5S19]